MLPGVRVDNWSSLRQSTFNSINNNQRHGVIMYAVIHRCGRGLIVICHNMICSRQNFFIVYFNICVFTFTYFFCYLISHKDKLIQSVSGWISSKPQLDSCSSGVRPLERYNCSHCNQGLIKTWDTRCVQLFIRQNRKPAGSGLYRVRVEYPW